MLSKFHPLVAYIVANEDDMFADVILRETALLALCRYMSVSYELCEKYLPLLFTALDKEVCPKARTTVLIGLGDLAFRFPNALEPWTSHLYSRLNDQHTGVRYNTLTVLTHLILNDMIKVKGQVSHVVLCLNDNCDKIKDLAITFFTKLSERSNNPVYNLLGDIIATLSRDAVILPTSAADITVVSKKSKKRVTDDNNEEDQTEDGEDHDDEVPAAVNTTTMIDTSFATALAASDSMIHVAELSEAIINIPANKYLNKTEFQKVMSFMLSFVKKDIQANSLLDRLLVRLSMATSQAQKQKLSYCISQLKINEKGVKKIVEAFKNIKEALFDPEIREHIVTTVRSVKRTINVRAHHQNASNDETQDGGANAETAATTAAGGGSSASASTAAETKNILLEFETLLDELDTGAAASSMNGMSLQDPNQTFDENNDDNTVNEGELTNHSINTTSILQSTKKGGVKKTATATKSKAKSAPVSASAATKKKTSKSRYEESDDDDDDDDNDDDDEDVENLQVNRTNQKTNKSAASSANKGKDIGRSATRRVGGRSTRLQQVDEED